METKDLHKLKMYEIYLVGTMERNLEKAKRYSLLETDMLVENQILDNVKNKLYVFFPELKEYKI